MRRHALPLLTSAAALFLVAAAPPPHCFPPKVGVDDFERRWFCGHLAAAGEWALRGDPAYRFTYLPTFDHPRIVTVTLVRDEPIVVGKVLTGHGGYEPGSISRTTQRVLAAGEWRLLLQRLENAGMWQPSDVQATIGPDGSEWLLEGRHAAQYRLHKVWSPTEASFPQYRRVCSYMLELAGIVPDHELY